MAEYFKEPQNPLKKIDEKTGDITYVYPMTTAKQVIMDDDGTRLNTILNENILYLGESEDGMNIVPVDADTLGGVAAEEYATKEYVNNNSISTYIYSTGKLTGSGENGKFKATVSETVSSITVNGTTCSVNCGGESEIELVAGCWYTFILDGTVVNFNKGGAGSAILNFKIVSGVEEPTSPKENTLWINTETAIEDWQFSYWAPITRSDGSALQKGDIWIDCSSDRAYRANINKKNGVNLPIYGIYQYDGSSFTELITNNNKLYQNGEWIDIVNYVYKEGNHIVEPIKNNSVSSLKTTSITENTASISMYAYHHISCSINWYVDLTNIKTLTLNVTSKSNQNSWGNRHLFGIATSAIPAGENVAPSRATKYVESQTTGELMFDVSEYSGYYYVFVTNNTSGDYQSCTTVIDKILCK